MKKAPSSVILFNEALKRGLQPEWLTPYGFFIFSYKKQLIYVYQTKNFANNQLCTWLTTDKYASRVLLEKYNLPNIPFFYAKQKNQLNKFFDQYQQIIAKPVLGEMAQDVYLIKEREKLNKFNLETTIFEQYISGTEYRYLLIKGQIVAVQKKEPDPKPKHPWRKKRTNIIFQNYDSDLVKLAKKIHSLIPQNILAIDFIISKNKQKFILELNSMPGLWSFSNPHLGELIDLAPLVLDTIIESQVKKP